jgi:hypothetical protein
MLEYISIYDGYTEKDNENKDIEDSNTDKSDKDDKETNQEDLASNNNEVKLQTTVVTDIKPKKNNKEIVDFWEKHTVKRSKENTDKTQEISQATKTKTKTKKDPMAD